MQSGASSASTTPTSAQAGDTTIVAIAPAKGAGMTLPQFLGLNDLAKGLVGLFRQGQNFLGSIYPGLEPIPALKSITDPANASSSTPSVAAAASVKSDEDQSRQKIKSLRYLATIGCGGCYPDVEKAFLSALSDCTEDVRLEAVKAIRQTAGSKCAYCNTHKCCSEKIREKLWQLAYGVDDQGCPSEPSARVRRFARMTLKACGTGGVVVSDSLPTEGPPAETPPPSGPTEGPTGGEATPVAPTNASSQTSQASGAATGGAYPVAQAQHAEIQHAEILTTSLEVSWEQVTAPFSQFENPGEARAAIEQVRMLIAGHAADPPDAALLRRLHSRRFDWTPAESMVSDIARRAAFENRLGEMTVFSDSYGVHLLRILQRRERPQVRRRDDGAVVTPATAQALPPPRRLAPP
ncbi:MAG: hypothetical protein RIC55_18565 [Pirellulaceae bacterium]